MALLYIIKYGNPVLTEKAEEIRIIDKEIEELAQNMVETMHAAPGIGLAAPQVNVSKRLITIDLSIGEEKQNLIILANPELIHQEGEKITRPFRVIVRGIDLKGNEKIIEAEGILARVFCHEIDHINGKLIIDHFSPLKKKLARKKLKKQSHLGKI
jgi:peptide deformylase